jgi:hypothetical protein
MTEPQQSLATRRLGTAEHCHHAPATLRRLAALSAAAVALAHAIRYG